MPAFGNAFAGIVPKHIFQPADDEGRLLTIEDWKGAGPFMAKEFRKDEFFETERNEDYFVENRPLLDGVRVFRLAIDRQKMIDLVVQGSGEIIPWCHWGLGTALSLWRR